MSARDRIGAMQAGNQPAPARGRRRPPDEDPAPEQPPPPAPAEPPARDLTLVPDTSDSASKLASMLAKPDETAEAAGYRPDTSAEPQIPLSALTSPPPLDPELDLVNLGVRAPRYFAEAIRTQAFLERRTQQDVVLGALRGERPINPDLLQECRRNATRTRR